MKFLIALTFIVFSAFAHADLLPDPKVTPGIARTDMTVEEICAKKWGEDVRHVTAKMKRQIFANYGYTGNDDPRCIPDDSNRHCELDHLIGRQFGGADDISNMWPQSYGGEWSAVDKDRLENKLRKMVCDTNELTLEEAQDEIKTDWIASYKKHFGD